MNPIDDDSDEWTSETDEGDLHRSPKSADEAGAGLLAGDLVELEQAIQPGQLLLVGYSSVVEDCIAPGFSYACRLAIAERFSVVEDSDDDEENSNDGSSDDKSDKTRLLGYLLERPEPRPQDAGEAPFTMLQANRARRIELRPHLEVLGFFPFGRDGTWNTNLFAWHQPNALDRFFRFPKDLYDAILATNYGGYPQPISDLLPLITKLSNAAGGGTGDVDHDVERHAAAASNPRAGNQSSPAFQLLPQSMPYVCNATQHLMLRCLRLGNIFAAGCPVLPECIWGNAHRRAEYQDTVGQYLFYISRTPDQSSFHREVAEVIFHIEQLVQLGRRWPTKPLDLLTEYSNRRAAQKVALLPNLAMASATKDFIPDDLPGLLQAAEPCFDLRPSRSFNDPGHVKYARKEADETVHRWLVSHRPPRLMTCFGHAIVRLELNNPLRLANSHEGYVCDMCNVKGIQVAWQVSTDDGERDVSAFYNRTSGLDVCVACGVYYCATQSRALAAVLNDPLSVAQMSTIFPADWDSVAVGAPNGSTETFSPSPVAQPSPPYIGLRAAQKTFHPTVAKLRISQIRIVSPQLLIVTVSISPRGAHVIGWGKTYTYESGAASKDALTKASELSLPGEDWRSRCRPTHPSLEGKESCEGDGLGDCALCLDPLRLEEGDCVQTQCNHWYHVRCIRQLTRNHRMDDYQHNQASAEDEDAQDREEGGEEAAKSSGAAKRTAQIFKCPLCRCVNQIGLDEDPETVLANNFYNVHLTCADVGDVGSVQPSTGKPQSMRCFTFAIGSILSIDGKLVAETDLAALAKCTVTIPSQQCVV
jgi:hypothetical protein